MDKLFNKKVFVIIMLCFVLTLILPSSVSAVQDKQVIMIIVNQVNFQDLLEISSIANIMEDSGIGLMNTRTAGAAIIPKAYSTIGAGVRAEGNWITSQAFHSTQENKEIYYARTGKKAPDQGIVNLDINKLISYNDAGEYQAIAGQLGSLIKEEGLKTAVYGNMNSEDENRSPHITIGMDKWGRVEQGDISKDILIEDSSFPGGLRTDFPKVYDLINQNSAALTIIETGDITRLEEERENLSPQMYEKHKSYTLKEMDSFIKDIISLAEKENKLLMFVTPFANNLDIKSGYQLTPLILYGDNIEKGVLTSSTTRRKGIIGNVDIAPTILEYLDIEQINMVGKSIKVVPTHDHLNSLLDLYDFIVATSKNRLPVLSFFAIYQILLLITALIMVLFKKKMSMEYYSLTKNLLLSGLVIPVVLLYLPILRIKSLSLTFITMILITAFLSWMVYYIGKKLNNSVLPVIILSLLITIGLMGDIMMGSPLIRTSLLGYDPIIGARYYGIGNEYMGVLVGAALVLFLGIKEIYNVPKSLIISFLMVLIFVIGYPKWGANVGGTITATMATIFIFLRLYNIKIGWKQLIFGIIAVALVVIIMAMIDMMILENQSHLATAIASIKEGGVASIFTIISRKIAMNIRLFGVTIWSKVLVATLIVFAILFYKPYGELKKIFDQYPYISIGWAGIVVASITGFMVNDSGVVAAATCLIFLSFSFLYILIQEPYNS